MSKTRIYSVSLIDEGKQIDIVVSGVYLLSEAVSLAASRHPGSDVRRAEVTHYDEVIEA